MKEVRNNNRLESVTFRHAFRFAHTTLRQTPCPDVQCWRVCAQVGFAKFTLFDYPRVLCRPTLPTLNARGSGGSSLELLHVNLRECSLRTFFHQQSPYAWSCIALWYESATDMCAHTTRDHMLVPTKTHISLERNLCLM